MRTLNLTESGFGLDTEITAALLRLGVRPFEVPVSYFSRVHAEGKKIRWHDAVACLWILGRVRVGRAYSRKRAALPTAEARSQDSLAAAKPLKVSPSGDDYALRVTG